MDFPPVSASVQRSHRTRQNRCVCLAISGRNLGPLPLVAAWRLGPCSSGFRRLGARPVRLPTQVHPPLAQDGFLPLQYSASWRTGACGFRFTPLRSTLMLVTQTGREIVPMLPRFRLVAMSMQRLQMCRARVAVLPLAMVHRDPVVMLAEQATRTTSATLRLQ
jgi:hypothetical protein